MTDEIRRCAVTGKVVSGVNSTFAQGGDAILAAQLLRYERGEIRRDEIALRALPLISAETFYGGRYADTIRELLEEME